jgi:hypothetical protein
MRGGRDARARGPRQAGFCCSESLRIKASATKAPALVITGKRCGTTRFTRARYSPAVRPLFFKSIQI